MNSDLLNKITQPINQNDENDIDLNLSNPPSAGNAIIVSSGTDSENSNINLLKGNDMVIDINKNSDDNIIDLSNPMDLPSISDSMKTGNKPTNKLLNNQVKLSSEDTKSKIVGVNNMDLIKGTLNEPVMDTFKRDLYRIGKKIFFVLNPYGNEEEKPKQLLQWDLWGPLLFNIILAITLSFNNDDVGNAFVVVFLIFWLGSFIIYINSLLLEAKTSLFQLICLIGYCMVPLNIIAIILALGNFYDFFRFILVAFGCGWATYSCIGYVKNAVSPDKKYMLLYPILLLYLFLSTVILMNGGYVPSPTSNVPIIQNPEISQIEPTNIEPVIPEQNQPIIEEPTIEPDYDLGNQTIIESNTTLNEEPKTPTIF